MRHEIRVGQSADLGPGSLAVEAVNESVLVGSDGKRRAERSAEVRLNGERFVVREGSLLDISGFQFRVVRVVQKGGVGLVRLLPSDERGRFSSMLSGFENSATPFAIGMLFLNSGVQAVNEVLARIDDHPDLVGELAESLRPGKRMLEAGLKDLKKNGASAGLVSYVERYLRVCSEILETAETSTQERIV